MQTTHQITFGDARRMKDVADQSVDLVVTSPPYPMIQMWDNLFRSLDPAVGEALDQQRGLAAFERMHGVLDPVWLEVYRVLKPGAIACINIGDAVRTVGDDFCIYPNHVRVVSRMLAIGCQPLPGILWRKPTNAPTKFMGAGMLPPGAYVTLEHEHILVFRKGSKRPFAGKEAEKRRESAYFWEERNEWFSDIWTDLLGAAQDLADKTVRKRSAAFPFELPFRLINMFSVAEDVVLDPFLGVGTTMAAAMVCGRSCIGYELDPALGPSALKTISAAVSGGSQRLRDRLKGHLEFVEKKTIEGREFKHLNGFYRFPVMTRQESALIIHRPTAVTPFSENSFTVHYERLTDDTGPQQPIVSSYPPHGIGQPSRGQLFDD